MELDENEARYRALLDMQDEIILRRDAAGRLTFVNSSFARFFGVEADAVLDTDFLPNVLAVEGAGPLSPDSDVRRRRYAELIALSKGERWIEWEENLVPARTAQASKSKIWTDVTEARNAETQLSIARDQAETANRAKSRFLAAISHEIRTPMNGIMGMASLLLDTTLAPEQQTYARAIDQSARTLLALIDEILDFSKIEAGKLVLQESLYVSYVHSGARSNCWPRRRRKESEIAWTVDPKLPERVLGDESRVRQILLNLISTR